MLLTFLTIILKIHYTFCEEEPPPGPLTDLNICKVSHLGLEYTGRIGKTESLVRCQSWTSSTPHQIKDDILDTNFPEGSRKLAKNYCRNPSKDPEGPWCYTMSTDLQYETCALPLCKFSQCKVTGPGMEYAGEHSKASSTRNCLKWNKDRSKVKENGSYISIPKFNKAVFPDETLSDAKKYCRNPNGDIAGPWCFVEDEDSGEIEKEYCNIPFCDDPDCLVFSKNSDTYMHYTDFNNTLVNLTFGVKLWDSDSYLQASARLVLSLLPLPLTGKEIEDAGIGLELLIGNNYSTIRFGNKDKPEYEPTLGIIKSTSFTMFSLSWHQGFISFGYEGKTKPIFLAEYRTKGNLLGYKMNKFNYYSVQGTNILWSFPFCKDDYECDAHTTTGKEFQQFWPLREKGAGYDLYVYVRAHHSACVLFVLSPVLDYPSVKLTLSGQNNFTRISVVEYAGAPERGLLEIQLENVLDYWIWREFSIGFFANIMTVYVEKPQGLQLIAEVYDEVFRNIRWFSVSSINTVAHWSFYCIPPPGANPPQAFLPECALNSQELNYGGTQDVTETGLPCVPWSSTKLIGEEIKFPNNTALEVWNYCRDPAEEIKGTYCFAMSLYPEKTVSKTYCHIRKCKSEQCKIAGTAHDYSGTLMKTRSNRTCLTWVPNLSFKMERTASESSFNSTTTISTFLIPRDYRNVWNDSLFPENSAAKAENYCRNPSRMPSGCWCYTPDANVLEDSCNVRDCDKPDECIVILSTTQKSRKIFILPQWKETGHHGGLKFALKEWNPDYQDGINFRITPKEGLSSITLQIAADNNERIKLIKDDTVVEQKTIPHLIGAGYCTPDVVAAQVTIPSRNNNKDVVVCSASFLGEAIQDQPPPAIVRELFAYCKRNNKQLAIGCDANSHHRDWGNSDIKVRGRWTDLWLQIRRGEIMLGLEGIPNALFEWTSPNKHEEFEPIFLSYTSIAGKPIGVSFKCDECHTENTTLMDFKHWFPIGLWAEEQASFNNFTLLVRGTGVIIIRLMRMIEFHSFYNLIIDTDYNQLSLLKINNYSKRSILQIESVRNLMTTNSWTRYDLFFNETHFILKKDNDTILYHKSRKPLLMYWFTIAPQMGWVTWAANCEPIDLDGPPRDGGWSKWSPWTCTAPCGGGDGYRTRTCSNPRPNISGRLCHGLATSTGVCNNFPCGDVNPETLEKIRDHLQHQNFSYVIQEGASQWLRNDKDILKVVARDSPKAYYEWTLNGVFIKPEPNRVVFQKDDINIKFALSRDSGLYVCMLFRINKQRVVLRVIALAVISSDYNYDTRATRSLNLPCNSVILGYIYMNLRLKIYLNDKVYIDHGTTTLAAVNTYFFENLNEEHSGDWKCVVEQRDLKLSWVTNYVKVNVKKAPNIYTNLMEDDLTRPIFGWMKSEIMVLFALFFIVAIVILLVVGFLILYKKHCTLQTPRNRRYGK